jgi:HlyD family secretion protein
MSKGTSTLKPDAADFAPGLLSIQEAPPSRLPRVVLWLVISLVGVLFLWAVFGKLDIIASAEGRLVPQTYVKIVQPADAGIVQEILVREGEPVRAGQALMRMDMKLTEADAATLRNEIAVKSLTLRRVDAEIAGAPLLRKADDPAQLFLQIDAQYRAHRQAYLDAIAQEQEALKKARHDLGGAEQALHKLEQTVPIYQRTAASYEKLSKEGFVSALAADEKTRDRIEKEQELKVQASAVASLKATIGASEKKMAQITSNYRSQLQNERVEAEAQVHRLRQEYAKVEHKATLLELRAPQAGIIKDLATHTVGTVVQPGSVLMSLVPHDEPLQAEVFVRNEDVGFVYADQKAKIKLSAYPFQKYGMIDGTVVHLGADAADPTNDKNRDPRAAIQSNYKALVRLERQSLEMEGQPLKLAAGMQVIAEIHQGQRTVMEYLLSPVQKAFHEAARER